MIPGGASPWMALAATPLLGAALTIGAFALFARLQRRLGGHPLAGPVLPAAAVIAALLHFTGTPEASYASGARLIHFLLGPATVALALPLHSQIEHVRRSLVPVLVATAAGAAVAAGSAVGIAWALGAPPAMLLSLAPKSVTTPIALGIAEKIGGDPGSTMVFVLLTGTAGAMTGTGIFRMLRIRDERAVGLGLGVASHGIGTSRAVQVGETAGAFSSLAMGLTGAITAVLLPLVVRLLR